MSSVQTAAFGDLVRRYRMAANLTQEGLAEQSGLSARAISDIERGAKHTPRKDTVGLLADALDLSEQERTAFIAAARRMGTTAATSASARLLARSGGAPPLAGRLREIASLERHLAGNGPPMLLLAGEPGIGKTRLLHEAVLHAEAGGWSIVSSGCFRRGGQEPYAPLVEALQSHIRVQSPAQLRAELQRCAWLVRLLPELVESADLPLPSLALPPEQEQRLMFGAVARFLANVAGPAGTLLVLDDLQWAGPDALDLLSMLVRSPSEKPLRVVGAYRDTDVRLQDPFAVFLVDLVRDGLAFQIRLDPLASDEAAALLRGLLERVDRPESEQGSLAQQVLRRAEGVPFFLVSCVQGLSAGALTSGATDAVPWDVAQSIRQRVAALPKAAQEMLGVAAIAGQQANRGVLVAVAMDAGTGESEVLAALDAACQAGLLAEEGDEGYQFAHNLIREVVRDDLGAARRATVHRRVAEVLERGPGLCPAELLAYHYDRGGQVEKALLYLERAGDRAQKVHANVAAATYYKELVGRLDALGRPLESARARERLGATLRIVAQYDQALEVLQQAGEAYCVAGDLEGDGRAMAQLGRVHARRGTPQEGVARLLPLLKPLAEAHASRSLAAVQVALADLYYTSGRPREQLAAAERAVELARAVKDDGMLTSAEQWRSIALLTLGRAEEALPALKEVIPLAQAAGDLSSYSQSLHHVALAYIQRGEFAESRSHIERALAAAEQRGDPSQIAYMTYNRGLIAYFSGAWTEARVDYEQAAAMMRQIGMSWPAAYPLLGLGQLCLAKGQSEDASGYLQEATAMAERVGDLTALRFAHIPLVERDLLAGQPEHARARLDRLLDRTTVGWEEGVAHILLFLAWAHLEMADEAQAEALTALSITRALTEQNRLALVDALRVQTMWSMRSQRWQEAERGLEEALSLARAMPYPYGEARVLYTRGLAHAQMGQTRLAREHLECALAICARLGERLYAQRIEQVLAGMT